MAEKKIKKGLFITFEGPEGCGKSTHSRKTVEFLKSKGYECLHLREPGGTEVGERVRQILLDPEIKDMTSAAELMLFEAARAEISLKVIRPAVKKGMIVICDRFNDSTVVYQGYAGKLPINDIMKVDNIATGGLKPELTIYLDIDVKVGLERTTRHEEKDRIEKKPLEYHEMVRKGYLTLAKKFPKRIKLIKVKDNLDETFALVKNEICGLLGTTA